MTPREPPHRSWCFTVFNPTPEMEAAVVALEPKADRIVVGREKCPTTGTLHLQGYIRFDSQKRFGTVKSLLPDGSHIEPRKGSESQATAYCKKDGSILIDKGVDTDRGSSQRDRKRSRDEETDEIIEEIEKGEKYGAIRNRHKRFFFWHRRNVIAYMFDERRSRANPEYDLDFDPDRLRDI